ncbi:uncharacterized protein [Amphiura filiformis]|uniref:uncharacterized protein n=1 Tax=Amphiura filiformis TaxID=82378 RepID=UPI003B21C331
MDAFVSQIQSLDASDIACILRQVQGGELTLEETPSGSNQSTSHSQASYSRGVEPMRDSSSIIETVQHAAETIAQTDSDSDPILSAGRLMNLQRPGQNTLPLQSTDVHIPVPHSRTELQKQIFQARLMGAPSEVAERITRKTGFGSPPRVRPNIGLSRSLSHPVHQEERTTGDVGRMTERYDYPDQRLEHRREINVYHDRSRSPLRRDERRPPEERRRSSSDRRHSGEWKFDRSPETQATCRMSSMDRSSHKSWDRDRVEHESSSKRLSKEHDRSRLEDGKKKNTYKNRRKAKREERKRQDEDRKRQDGDRKRQDGDRNRQDEDRKRQDGDRKRQDGDRKRQDEDRKRQDGDRKRQDGDRNRQDGGNPSSDGNTKSEHKETQRGKKRKKQDDGDEKEERRSTSSISEDSNANPRYLLSGITPNMTSEDISQYFSKFGLITDLTLAPSEGCGYIEYKKARRHKRAKESKRENSYIIGTMYCVEVSLYVQELILHLSRLYSRRLKMETYHQTTRI